jgi:hypothetical protein
MKGPLTIGFILAVGHSLLADISVTTYGADPSGMSDSTSAMESAIAAAQTSGDRVVLPSGTFLITRNLTVSKSIEIVGAGKRATTLYFLTTADAALNLVANGSAIRDLFIYAGSQGQTGTTAVYVDKDGCEVTNVMIQNFSVGVLGGGVRHLKLRNVDTVFNAQTPQVSDAVRLVNKSSYVQISDCQLQSVGRAVAILGSASSPSSAILIANSLLTGQFALYAENTISLQVTNSVLDLTDVYAVFVQSSRGFLLSNSWVYSSSGEAVVLENCADSVVTGSNLKCAAGARVVSILGNSALNRITNNTLQTDVATSDNVFLGPLTGFNLVEGNHVHRSAGGVYSPGSIVNASPAENGNVIRDNITGN